MLSECHIYRDTVGHPCGWALWRMEEPEEVLRSLCPADCPPCSYSNTARRTEYYAVRALLAAVLGRDKVIAYHPSGRPYLADHSFYVSISHTRGVCALAWHAAHPVGVDVEQIADRVSRVAHRFVSSDEQRGLEAHFPADLTRGQLLLWSAKEAAYKRIDRPSTDFLQDIIVRLDTLDPASGRCQVCCRTDGPDATPAHHLYPLRYRFYPDFVFVLAGMEEDVVADMADSIPTLE